MDEPLPPPPADLVPVTAVPCNPMRAGGWNIRGFGQSGRYTQFKDCMRKENLDIVFLQETIKKVLY